MLMSQQHITNKISFIHHTPGATEQVNTYKATLEFKDKPVKAYAMDFAGSVYVYPSPEYHELMFLFIHDSTI